MMGVEIFLEENPKIPKVVVVSSEDFKKLYREDIKKFDVRIREGTIYAILDSEEYSMEIGSKISDILDNLKINDIQLDVNFGEPKEILLGFILTKYKFDKYKKDKITKSIRIYTTSISERDKRYIEIISESVFLARDLGNDRPNNINPSKIVEIIEEIFRDLPVSIKVFDSNYLKEHGFGGIYGVGKGSVHPPVLVILEHLPVDNEKPIVLVGKGVCFDAGGIHLKPTGYIEDMHIDMHGAASVIAALYGYIKLEKEGFVPKKNIVVITPFVENLPSDKSLKPSEIIKHYNGLTTEIVNTDAEGRLILADALAYASEHYDPKIIIDLATLTGAQIVALGENVAAIMGNNKEFIQKLVEIGNKTKEYLWELPLLEYKEIYLDMVKGDVSDLKNIPSPRSREAGTIVGGAFLWNFVKENIPWIHIDIAGPAIHSKKWFWMPKGATGFGVRLLIEFIKEI